MIILSCNNTYECFKCHKKINYLKENSSKIELRNTITCSIQYFKKNNIFKILSLCENCTTLVSGIKFNQDIPVFKQTNTWRCNKCFSYPFFIYNFRFFQKRFYSTGYIAFCEKCWLKYAGKNWLFEE